MSECLNNIKKSNVSKSFDSLEAWSMQVWWKADGALHRYIDQKQNLRDFGLSRWAQQICGVKWERGAKEILCCKRNQWRLDASIMRLGANTSFRKRRQWWKVFCGNFRKQFFPAVWPNKNFSTISCFRKYFFGWVPAAVVGGGSSRGATSSLGLPPTRPY